MKKILLIVVGFCFCASSFGQETLYIRDTLYVTLRSDLSDQSEVVFTGLVSGTAVTLLEESEDGLDSRVRTKDGTDGWIQTQYLSEDTATKLDLQQANERLVLLEDENTRLSQALNNLEGVSELASQQGQELEEIKTVAANAITLKTENVALLEENGQLTEGLQAAQVEAQVLESKLENDSYLNAAYAVLIGVLITLVVPRLRRSKSNEWA